MSSASDTQTSCFSGLFKWKFASKQQPVQSRHSCSDVVSHPPDSGSDSDGGEKCGFLNPSCYFSYGKESEWWLDSNVLPAYSRVDPQAPKSGFIRTIEGELDELNPKLRELSLRIHSHPEVMWKEKFAHDTLTKFMSEHGFKITKHYLGLDTAWRAEFTNGNGGRVLGVNSEMDALPGIGHGCGHNLIAVSGVGVAIAVKAALIAHNVSGKVVLLGTPAEEGGGGKQILLERGGYKDMDVCMMCHPAAGPPHLMSTGSTNAMQPIDVEFFGQSAHAAGAPWEGTNALDAAFLAYSNISVLRQQIKPDHRVHGILEGRGWAPNVIPDYAKMRYVARAAASTDLTEFVKRLNACFEAAALATGCKIKLSYGVLYYDLRQNAVLAEEFADVIGSRYGYSTNEASTAASTDFGNVSYALPSIHPSYVIPTEPSGANHTIGFTRSAATQEAHDVTMVATKGLAATGFRVLHDDAFFQEVRSAFDEQGA